MDKPIPAIVMGTELPRATAIIRSIGRAGIPVIAFDHRERMPGSYSRYISERVISRHRAEGRNDKIGSQSNWFFSADQALDRLRVLGKRGGGGVLIPTNDDYSLLVAKHQDELCQWFLPSAPDWAVLAQFFDKARCQTMAQQAGVAVPEWFAPTDSSQAITILRALDFEHSAYIFKLNPSAGGPCDPVSGAMTRPAGATLQAAIDNYLEVAGRVEPPMIQEVIPGDASVCVGVTMLINRSCEVLFTYCVQRLLLQTYATGGEQIHPYELGANIYAQSCHDDGAVEAAREIMRETGYFGVVTVEFRRRQSDNKLFFMKVDPRFVNATGLATGIGIDLPKALYDSTVGQSVITSPGYPEGISWIWIDRSLRTVLRNRRRIPVRTQIAAIWSRRKSIRSFAYFDRRDPRPCLRAWVMEMKWQIANWKRRPR